MSMPPMSGAAERGRGQPKDRQGDTRDVKERGQGPLPLSSLSPLKDQSKTSPNF